MAASGGPAWTEDIVTDTAATEEGPLDQRAHRHGPSGGKVGNKGGRRHRLVGRGAGGRRQGTVTQQPIRGGADTLRRNNPLIRSGAWARMRRRRRCFPSPIHPSMLLPPQQRRAWHRQTQPRCGQKKVSRRRRQTRYRGPTGFSTRSERRRWSRWLSSFSLKSLNKFQSQQ